MRASALAVLVGVMGCWGCLGGGGGVGTSTGNPSDGGGSGVGPDIGTGGDNGGSPTGGEGSGFGFCGGGTPEVVAVDGQTQLGVSAQDILAFAEGSHDEELRWNEQELASYGPESGIGRITVTIERGEGEVRFIPPGENTSGIEPAIGGVGGECEGVLEIDVEVTLKSAGGALDERFSGTLRSVDARQATLSARLDPAELGGEFEVTEVKLDGFMLSQLDVRMSFTPYGSSGSLSGTFEMRTSDAVGAAAGGPPLAEWGRAGCQSFEVAIGPEDEVDGVSAQQVAQALRETTTATVRFGDGSTSPLEIGFEPDGDEACLQLGGGEQGGPDLRVMGTLTLRSEDGVVDGSWPGVLHGVVQDGALQQVSFELDSRNPLPEVTAENLGSVGGLPMLDGSGYDSLSVSVRLTVVVAGGGAVMGELRANGYSYADCAAGSDEPPADQEMQGEGAGGASGSGAAGGSSPGCAGAEVTALLEGTIE